MDVNNVIATYDRCNHSIKQTSRQLSLSFSVVRKCLVTGGVLKDRLTNIVAEMLEKGMSQKEISEKLGISDSWVNSNAPYIRGSYLVPSTSINAERIRKCRERKIK